MVVEPARPHQLVVAALLQDAALLQHDDPVGVADGPQAVGDDHAGPAGEQHLQRLLDRLFGEAVDVGRGLVEDQDLRVGDQGAGERDQLALADRDVAPALAQPGVVTVGQAHDEVVGRHGLGRRHDVLAGGGERVVADVLLDGAGEQEGLLQDHGDPPAQAVEGHIAHVDPAHQHRALVDLVEPVSQRDDRGLARTRGSDQGHDFARVHLEADVMQDRPGGVVAEGDVPELDRGLEVLQGDRVGLVLDGDRHVQHLEDPVTARHRPLHDGVLHRQHPDRVEEPLHIEDEGDHHADLQPPGQHGVTANNDHDGHGQAGQEIDGGRHDAAHPGRADLGPEILLRLLGVEFEIELLASGLLDRAHAVDVLGQGRIGGRRGVAGLAERGLGIGQPDRPDRHQHRQHGERQQAQPDVQAEQDDSDADQHDDVAHRAGRAFQEVLQGIHVALQPGHDPPDMGLVHERQRDVLEVGEHGAADVEDHPLRQPLGQPFGQVEGGHIGRRRQGKPHEAGLEARHVMLHHRAHRPADQQRDADLGRGRGHGGYLGADEDPPVRAHVAEETADDPCVEGPEDVIALGRAQRGPGLSAPAILAFRRRPAHAPASATTASSRTAPASERLCNS